MRATSTATLPLILASSSPRRRALLAPLFPLLEVQASEIDEEAWTETDPVGLTLALSRAKAEAVADARPGELILGADTVVAVDGEILGKPSSSQHARSMLERLRGRVHDVFTGITLLTPEGRTPISSAVRSRVWFRDCSDRELSDYASSGEPMDKAGAYAIQGGGGRLVERIEGCYANIIGLPVCEVFHSLRAALGEFEVPAQACRTADGGECPRTT